MVSGILLHELNIDLLAHTSATTLQQGHNVPNTTTSTRAKQGLVHNSELDVRSESYNVSLSMTVCGSNH